jgi:hypothetical protein
MTVALGVSPGWLAGRCLTMFCRSRSVRMIEHEAPGRFLPRRRSESCTVRAFLEARESKGFELVHTLFR